MVNADDIAKLARELATPMANEARIRCSVSRAYYAAFHYCDLAANTWCKPLSKDDEKDRQTHQQLYHRLENFSIDKTTEKDLQAMSQEAKNLRSLRVQADYYLNEKLDQKTIARSLNYMSQVKLYLDSIKKVTTKDATNESKK